MQFPRINFDSPLARLEDVNANQQSGYPTPTSVLDSLANGNESSFVKDFVLPTPIPEDTVLFELIELFFAHFQDSFPCFHRITIMDDLRTRKLQTESPLLLYSMCAIAARWHSNPAIKALERDWYQQAKFFYELTERYPEPGLRTLQAVICLIFHATTVGDFSAGYIYLGKAWRQACALGLNRLDAEENGTFFGPRPEPETCLEREESRRALWLLFIADRGQSWPTGWPHAIDDRHFKIDLPIAEVDFQAMTLQGTPLTRNLDTLIRSCSAPHPGDPLNMFHYLVVAHIMLGRTVEQVHSLHDPPDSPEYLQRLNHLDDQLIKFRLGLPRSALYILEAPEEARGHVIWLNTVLNTITILLHYRCAKFTTDEETNAHFLQVVIAARNTANVVKDTSRINIDLLLNPHIVALYYLAACVLLVQWRLTGDEALKSEMDLLRLVFERCQEVFAFLGLKFKLSLQRDLEKDLEGIKEMRMMGFRGLLADCSKWKYIREGLAVLC
ncbi:uncharacterized protein BDR25DRAFT_243335 [Lindgomyces ingoldianus]|uniref:Uncharacterized protein n=1 Tax=Lindgomyces ingoldianus TaxID=673940 RepID=A0ACB6QBV3_9PLEO|nr:uncharacterized protein BDR25DRAFT_243335 [Lindgomyces ingoldianus]KAF2464078.1 hypothetical protein BDR25DRAFT_243335 [Lindgomyces ingoldianus]